MKLKNTLLLGYGNPDRGDDGAAYYILTRLIKDYSTSKIDLFSSDIRQLTENDDILYGLQLLPEHSEMVSRYRVVVFIDAHTGEIEEEISILKVKPDFKHSPFTHHFSPESCLAVADSLTSRHPEGWLFSIRGYEFGFTRELSERTRELAEDAVKRIIKEFI